MDDQATRYFLLPSVFVFLLMLFAYWKGWLFTRTKCRRIKTVSGLAENNLLQEAKVWVRIFGGSFHHELGNNEKIAALIRERSATCDVEVLFGSDVDVDSIAILRAFKEGPRCRLYLIPRRFRHFVQTRGDDERRIHWRYQHFLIADGSAVTIETPHDLLFRPHGLFWRVPGKPTWLEWLENPRLARYLSLRFDRMREQFHAVELDKTRLVASIVQHGRFGRFEGEDRFATDIPDLVIELARKLGEEPPTREEVLAA